MLGAYTYQDPAIPIYNLDQPLSLSHTIPPGLHQRHIQSTSERETRGFTYLRKRYPNIQSTIVTAESAPIEFDQIDCQTAWRFCLEPPPQ